MDLVVEDGGAYCIELGGWVSVLRVQSISGAFETETKIGFCNIGLGEANVDECDISWRVRQSMLCMQVRNSAWTDCSGRPDRRSSPFFGGERGGGLKPRSVVNRLHFFSIPDAAFHLGLLPLSIFNSATSITQHISCLQRKQPRTDCFPWLGQPESLTSFQSDAPWSSQFLLCLDIRS